MANIYTYGGYNVAKESYLALNGTSAQAEARLNQAAGGGVLAAAIGGAIKGTPVAVAEARSAIANAAEEVSPLLNAPLEIGITSGGPAMASLPTLRLRFPSSTAGEVPQVRTTAPVGFSSNEAYLAELRAAQHAEATANMQSIVTRVSTRIRSLGMAALTPKQAYRASVNPGLYEAFIGNRIDVAARRLILGHGRTGIAPDPVIRGQLPSLRGNYTGGADFVDPPSGRWWDMTTPQQWPPHLATYGPNGTLLRTR